eukprot:11907352-Ditylum_brightwellii.AAC.1
MSLAGYKAGLPANACTLFTRALKQMEYTMMAVYRQSEITSKHLSTSPLHGIGQGPTNAPPGWTFNVDIVKNMLQQTVSWMHNHRLYRKVIY